MANPSISACAKDTWVKVATNVKTATIHKKITGRYLHTYRLTGAAAPTDLADAIRMEDQTLEYNHSAEIDIYIYCQNEAGSVRVDV